MTPQATCSKLGSKSYTHPHTTPKTTVIHTPYGSKSPKYADSLAGEKGRRPTQERAGGERTGEQQEQRREGRGSQDEGEGEREGRGTAEEGGGERRMKGQGEMRTVNLLRFLLQCSSGQMRIQGNPGVRVFARHLFVTIETKNSCINNHLPNFIAV